MNTTRTAVMGKIGQTVGNTLMFPDSDMDYDFFAFMNNGQPVFVKSSVHEGFINGGGTGDYNQTITGIQFSDGFGRLIQTRAQCEEVIFGDSLFGDSGLPASNTNANAVGIINADTENINVTVSGWQVYNNKGAVVEKYEPYYDKGFSYTSPASVTAKDALLLSKKVQMYYDPRGQVIQTINPDQSQQRIIFGIPLALDNPNVYDPTPWESYSYDANDLAELTNPGNTTVPASHYYTPSSSVIDCLGRTIRTTDRLVDSTDDNDQVIMKYSFDIRGNLLEVLDAYDRTVFTHVYDLLNRNLVTTRIDAGRKIAVLDCMSRPTEARDAKGALALSAYDELNRPVKAWARDNSTATDTTLRTHTIYGDSAGITDPEQYNLLGKPYQVLDEAGLSQINSYDFRGLPPEKFRQTIHDDVLNEVFDGPPTDWIITPFTVDWDSMDPSNYPTGILDPVQYTTSMEYDALGRVTKMLYPEDVDSERKTLLPTYNRAGALTAIDLKDTDVSDPVNYLQRIAYNAKGQRILAAYGNGVMTRYRYDETTFRLQRMRSEGYTVDEDGDTLTYEYGGTVRQNMFYTTDLVGNIVNTIDYTTGCGIAGADEMERDFEYDPLYRLLSATGRETAATATLPWEDQYRPENPTLSRGYTQSYTYDKLGNIEELQHVATGGNFTRAFVYKEPKTDNQLQSITIGANEYDFTYDANGNAISEGEISRHRVFDYGDKLKCFFTQISNEEPSVYTQYLYDASGTRVKKYTRKQGGTYISTSYIDGIFEYTKKDGTGVAIPYLTIGSWTIGSGSGIEEQNLLHLMDGAARIATRRIGDAMGDDTPEIKFNLEDHLNSSILLMDADGVFVNREEYYPFGETSFGSYAKKRYRYCGKELDEESGLYYYGMRYYSAWSCRFVSVDPLAEKYMKLTPYQYSSNNPINGRDIDGLENENQQGNTTEVTNGGGGVLGSLEYMQKQITNATTNNTDASGSSGTYFTGSGLVLNQGGGSVGKVDPVKGYKSSAQMDGEMNNVGSIPAESLRYQPWEPNGDFNTTDIIEETSTDSTDTLGGTNNIRTIEEVSKDIQENGFNRFLDYVNDSNYGTEYFFENSKKFEINATGWLLQVVERNHAVGDAFYISEWTHTLIADGTPANNKLEHLIGTFLMASKYGIPTAKDITNANEARGLLINDVQNGRVIDALTGTPGTAFEWKDLFNNSEGFQLYKSWLNSKNMNYSERQYYQHLNQTDFIYDD